MKGGFVKPRDKTETMLSWQESRRVVQAAENVKSSSSVKRNKTKLTDNNLYNLISSSFTSFFFFFPSILILHRFLLQKCGPNKTKLIVSGSI